MLKYAHFIVSCLYTWEADPQLDAGIESNGMLLRPAYGCLYGHLDRLHSLGPIFAQQEIVKFS